MQDDLNIQTPESAAQWYDLGVFYRQNARFGDAVNAFQKAADLALEESRGTSVTGEAVNGTVPVDCPEIQPVPETLRSRALASIELIKEINGFVNVDLMNP
ncbi:MAG: hypothetical protein NC115_06615 [Bacteroidales bacterium]|nr:hypothetical protein [Bacteroides sp.]MCM1198319.1 hypothetical protein [Clostridium sp.]MCM1502324.1 hypothetical protein [Bacteroidales bacterium]